ncbi:hypothetical protein PRIPAC_73947, partial [Pristionchus pacificus]|uniref:Uncharacterized protein n=1 Tax=Pristionchus pacificus TaxID=54126 RepID=A0A2A6B4K6_PRIPA
MRRPLEWSGLDREGYDTVLPDFWSSIMRNRNGFAVMRLNRLIMCPSSSAFSQWIKDQSYRFHRGRQIEDEDLVVRLDVAQFVKRRDSNVLERSKINDQRPYIILLCSR